MKQFAASDINPQMIRDVTVALIGYGSQGRAQALNLCESGVHVLVGARNLHSVSARTARADGFAVCSVVEAAKAARFIMLLTPDETHAAVYEQLERELDLTGKVLGFAHGYAVHYGLIVPSVGVDVVLVAPKGVGTAVRERYVAGSGVAGLVAVAQDASGKALEFALAYAWACGYARVALFETSFKEETEADLFSEQAIIVGGLTELLRAGYETLTAAGYSAEVAYFECIFEAKLILDLIAEQGFAGMFERISNTAEYGAQEVGKRIISPQTRKEMAKVLAEIQKGTFAHAWNKEVAQGMPHLFARRAESADSSFEATAAKMRDLLC